MPDPSFSLPVSGQSRERILRYSPREGGALVIPRPDWLTEEPDKWPDDAREFYRLCHAILTRTGGKLQAATENPISEGPAGEKAGAGRT